MEKQTINTIPNLLLEIMNVLAASQAQNIQQKINWHLAASCISHAFNPSMMVYLRPVSPSTYSQPVNSRLSYLVCWFCSIMGAKIFLGFFVRSACTFKIIFPYFLLLNFCLRSSQRVNRV